MHVVDGRILNVSHRVSSAVLRGFDQGPNKKKLSYCLGTMNLRAIGLWAGDLSLPYMSSCFSAGGWSLNDQASV